MFYARLDTVIHITDMTGMSSLINTITAYRLGQCTRVLQTADICNWLACTFQTMLDQTKRYCWLRSSIPIDFNIVSCFTHTCFSLFKL